MNAVRVQLKGLSSDRTELMAWVVVIDREKAADYIRNVNNGLMKDPFGKTWPETVAYIA